MENERLAKVEESVKNIDKGLMRLESKFDIIIEQFDHKFVPRPEVNETVRRIDTRIDEQEKEIKDLKMRNIRNVGYLVTIAAAFVYEVVHGFKL